MERDSGQSFQHILSKYRDHDKIKKCTSAFWNLFKSDQTGHIKYDSFKELLIRFLKVLVPCFRNQDDYSKYCLEEWRSATNLQNTMNFDRFHRAIFKIPHSWAINLDVNEYAKFLELLYHRVTARRVYSPERSKEGQLVLPNIFLQFPAEEETVLETITEAKAQKSQQQGKVTPSVGAEWESCDSEQSADSRYDYNFIEDEKEMAMKKQKRLKQTKKVHSLTQRLKQPIYYKECVEYSSESHPSPIFPIKPPSTNAIENPISPLIWKVVLAPLDEIIPFGSIPEQFIMDIKNESNDQQRPQSSASSVRNNTGGAMVAEVGDLIKVGDVYRDTSLKILPFTPSSTTATVCNRFFLRTSQIVSDILWHKCNNNMEIVLRLEAQRNLPGPRDVTTPPVLNNKTRCNPVLDRKIIMELHRVFEKAQYVNVNYIVPNEKITEILKSDLMRVENPQYLAMKPSAAASGPMGTTHMSGFNDAMKRPILLNEKTINELEKEMIGSKFEAISKERTKALQKENRKKREEENARREAEGQNEDQEKNEKQEEGQEENKKKQEEEGEGKQSQSRTSHRKEKTPSPRPGDVSGAKAGDISSLTLKTALVDSKQMAAGQMESAVSKNQSYLTGRNRQTVVQSSILHQNNGILPESMQPPMVFPQMTKCLMPQLLSKNGIKSDPLNNDLDLIKDAGKLPLSILIIGKSRSGKTTLARNLSIRLDLVHIEITIILNALFKKIAEYQPPDDIPDGEQPPKFLTELQQSVQNTLKSGQELSQQLVFSLLNTAIQSDAAQSKGFVLDLPFSRNGMKWGQMISNNVFPKMPAASISYIFDLTMSKQDSLLRAENMLMSNEEGELQQDGSGIGVFSRFDRSERKRIYQEFKKRMEEDDDFAADVTQENTPKQPLNENALVKRESDDPGLLKGEFEHFMIQEYPHFLNLKKKMFNQQYVRLISAGVSPVELAAACEVHVNETNPLRPLATILDPESDFKALLTQNVEDNQVPRIWSLWRQTDPVPLLENGRVIPGTPQFGSKYAGRVFVHSSQENQKKFIANPKRYIAINPQMPLSHRLAILGPKGSGRRQVGKRLCEIYGWKYVDIDKIALQKLQQQEEIENRQMTILRQSMDIDRSLEGPNLNTSVDPNQKRSRAGSRTSRKSGTRSKERTPSKIGSRKGSHTKTMSKEEPPNPHIANNPQDGGHVGFSLDEYNNVVSGGPFKATDVTAWILELLGVEMQQYREPPPPPPQKNQDDEDNDDAKQNTEAKDETKQEEEQEQEPSKDQIKQTPREGMQGEQGMMSSPDIGTRTPEPVMPRILEDLPINQISVKVDENWKPPFIGGFVFVAFPQNEEQFNRLKQQGIQFDKIIILNDTDEENPGKELRERNEKRNIDYEHEAEMEFLEKLKQIIKEQIGQENLESVLSQVSCNGSIEEVLTRVRLILDPFYTRVDSQENIRVSGDVNQPDEEDEAQIKKNPQNKGISPAIPIPKCSLGDFCPVTYYNESWLFPGGVTGQNLESYLNGKIFKFAGEKEMETFNADPLKYLGPGDEHQINSIQPIPPPLPHILMTGPRGSGVTTQIKKLSEFYRIDTQNIQEDFMTLLRQAKNQRKRDRLLKRGFKAPPVKQDQDEEEDQENKEEEQEAVDPQIDEDPEEFEKGDHQKQLMKDVMQPGQAKFYDGGWFDVNEEEVTTSYLDLLTDSRRLPQFVVLFTISEKRYLERLLDTKGITAKYESQMAELRRARKEEKERLKQEKLQERKRAIQAGQIDPDQINDEQAPMDQEQEEQEELEGEDVPNLQEMLTTQREKLTQRREKDSQWVDGIAQEFKAKKVPVVILNADLDIQIIHTKIKHALHDHLELRESLIERQHARPVRSIDSATFISSHILRRSKFCTDSLFTPTIPVKTLKYPAIYRERFYFFSSQDQRREFLKQPLKHSNIGLGKDCQNVQVEDIKSPPTAFVVGMPKSGRTTLCQKIASECGQVCISMDTVIKDFLKSDCILADEVRNQLGRGKALNDQKVVEILKIRLQQADCVKHGWVIDGFPQSLEQARMLSEKAGVVPKFVFELSVPENVVMQRSLGGGHADDAFGTDMRVIHARISKNQNDLPLMCKYFEQKFKNLRVLDGCKSKWFLISRAKHWFTEVEESIKSYTRAILQKKPVRLGNLNTTHETLLQHLSPDFSYFCPVTLKLKRKLYDCRDIEFIPVEYLQTVYLLKGESEWDYFRNNPQRFIKKQSLPKNLPQKLSIQKCGELANDAKGLESYCPVSLVDEQRLVHGNTMFAASNGNMEFVFETYEKLMRFMEMPQRYESVSLPVKMPPVKEHIRLDSLADGQDSVAFLEEAVGTVVSKALLEINSKRIKHPNLSVKETALKLFSLYLKANNPAANMFARQKYGKKLSQFIERCELPIQLLRQSRKKKNNPEDWQEFEEENYHVQGKVYDRAIAEIQKDKEDNFISYIR